MTHRSALLLAALLLPLVALAGVPREVGRRGWRPFLALSGAVTTEQAAARLRLGADTVRAVAGGLEVEPGTAELLGELRASLEEFELEDLYELLPEQAGPARQLRLIGRREGLRYRIGPPGPTETARVTSTGPLGTTLGDLALTASVRPLDLDGDAPRFLLGLEAGLGAGPFGWDQLAGGLAEAARLAASGDPNAIAPPEAARPGPKTRAAVLAAHPRLRPEDLEPVAVLWEALPTLSRELLEVAQLEDVLVLDLAGDGLVQQLRLSGRLLPDRLEGRYPELAAFLAGLGPVLHAQLTWRDAAGRPLARLLLDTEQLRLGLDAFVAGGELVAIERGRPCLEPGPVAASRRLRCEAELRSQVGDLTAHVRGLQSDWTVTRTSSPEGERVDVVATATRPPSVSVSGRVLGILPAWAIDLAIPGDLEGLIRGFFEVACAGDSGRGVNLTLRADQPVAGPATFEVAARGEVPDSALVRFAANVASLRLLPQPSVRAELYALVLRLQRAFVTDLARFEALERSR